MVVGQAEVVGEPRHQVGVPPDERVNGFAENDVLRSREVRLPRLSERRGGRLGLIAPRHPHAPSPGARPAHPPAAGCAPD